MNNPVVSVVMSVYNGEAYVKTAMDSILAQSFKDFEFIIVDDGSTDSTATILKGYTDPRIRIITQKNQGLVASLNTGIQEAVSGLIARQDADDASYPERLELQYKTMREDPNIVLTGSSMSTLDMSGRVINSHYVLLGDPELKQELLVRSPFPHGSVMFRKQAFRSAGGYLRNEYPAEDYGLWIRLAGYGKFANINQPLYMYRENLEGISRNNGSKQRNNTEALRTEAWKNRKQLLPPHISAAAYGRLEMEQDRLERIAGNILFCLAKALVRLELLSAVKLTRLLFASGAIRRKGARLILIKLRLKHV